MHTKTDVENRNKLKNFEEKELTLKSFYTS